jgi:uncharacterized protein YcbX
MASKSQTNLGSVVSLALSREVHDGEELNASDVTERGLIGDRVYALVDCSDGKAGSAKTPKNGQISSTSASFIEPPRTGAKIPPVRITPPDGTVVTSEQVDVRETLSKVLNREVTLDVTKPDNEIANAEEYWPDMEGLDYRDTVTDFAMPEGTFFDCAVVHLVTTATLDRLRELYPQGRFEVRRFRPNIVVEVSSDEKDFIENDWVGHTVLIGNEVRLSITGPCPRCVMTTLPQGDLPKDLGILRTAAKHNKANVGVYAGVLAGGTIRRGDPIRLE